MNETDLDVSSLYPYQANWKSVSISLPKYEVNDSFEHDGVNWYQLKVYFGSIGGWIETQDEELWWENTPEWKETRSLLLYTVHEKLYTYICLKWG